MTTSGWGWVVLVVACAACSSMTRDVTRSQLYRPTVSCAQGPFEIKVPALRGAYGERISVEVDTPRPVKLAVEIWAQGRRITAREPWVSGGSPGSSEAARHADNGRCFAGAGAARGGGAGARGGGGGAGGGGGDAAVAPALAWAAAYDADPPGRGVE